MTTTIERETAAKPGTARWRPVWRMGGALVTLAALVMGSVTVLGLLLQNSETASKTYKRPLSSLALDVDNADIELEPGPAGQVRVIRVTDWTAVKPEIQEDWESETLRIRTRCVIEVGKPCRVSYRLQVPPRLALTVKAVGGDVTARSLTGPVDVDLIGGNILLDDLTGDVVAASRGGDMMILQSRSKSVRVTAHAGNALVHFTTPPSAADIRMTAGDLDVRVPSGFAYALDAESIAGTRDVAVDDDLAAPHKIRARVSAGDLSVRYGSQG